MSSEGTRANYVIGHQQPFTLLRKDGQIRCLPACAGCGAQGRTKKCGGCKRSFYCSLDCQRAHWSAHKTQCLAYARNAPRDERMEVFVNNSHCLTSAEVEQVARGAASIMKMHGGIVLAAKRPINVPIYSTETERVRWFATNGLCFDLPPTVKERKSYRGTLFPRLSEESQHLLHVLDLHVVRERRYVFGVTFRSDETVLCYCEGSAVCVFVRFYSMDGKTGYSIRCGCESCKERNRTGS